jgi:hypothetical protein
MHLKHPFLPGVLFMLFALFGSGQETAVKSLKNDYKDHDPQDCLKLSASNRSQIILIRHGEPDLDKKGCRTRDEVIQFMKAYASVGVVPFDDPPICREGLNAESFKQSCGS